MGWRCEGARRSLLRGSVHRPLHFVRLVTDSGPGETVCGTWQKKCPDEDSRQCGKVGLGMAMSTK
jgi:hypothetical protein